MSLTIRTNIDSLRAQTQLSLHTRELGKTYEHLSSGLRITRASDDAAGLALADKLRAEHHIASVAIRNTNDGISLLNVADSALDTIGNLLLRMAELATSASNSTQTTTSRSALQSEFTELGNEITRIARTTTFNNNYLLSGSSSIRFQVGLDGSTNSQITYSAVTATLVTLGLSNSSEVLTYSLNATTAAAGEAAATTALAKVTSAISTLTGIRGNVGATESRLTFALDNLQVTREVLVDADNTIRDVDVASETANLVRLQILRDAATAVLAQANQQPSILLKLLE